VRYRISTLHIQEKNNEHDVFRAFADANDRDKINGLINAGLVKTGTLVLMERDIDSFTDFENDSGNETGIAAFDRSGGDASGGSGSLGKVELYEADRYGLSEYLSANREGFAIGTSESTIREELSYKNAAIYVLRLDKKIVSSVTVWDHDDETVATENIFTLPQYRNRHFMTRVLATALANAKARGIKKARLTVYSENDSAVRIYQKLGYTITKHIIEFGEDTGLK